MPRPGKRWRHIIINTRGSWLHGDQRGFRNRDHRIHSSGDYKHPPPKREHVNLHKYMKDRGAAEVTIPLDCRAIIGRVIIEFLIETGFRVLAISVGKVHTHFLAELPDNILQIRRIVGEAKRKSSRGVKKRLPGSIWAAGEEPKPVDNRGHQRRAYEYILLKQGWDSWTWSFEDGSFEGMLTHERRKLRDDSKNPGRRSARYTRCALPRRENNRR